MTVDWLTERAAPLPGAYNAQGPLGSRSSLLLRLPGLNGTLCYGEAAPLSGFSPETLDQTRDYLRRTLTPDSFLVALERCVKSAQSRSSQPGVSALDLAGLHELNPHASAPRSALFALDCALADGVGQALGLPVWRLLAQAGKLAARAEPAASAELFSLHYAAWEARFEDALSRGASTFKFKVGLDFETELSRLSQLRVRASSAGFRVDANGTLGAGGADWESRLSRLGALEVEFIEEPVPFEQLGRPRPLGCPLALDESLARLNPASAALQAWLQSGEIRALVVKPMLHGGLSSFEAWRVCAAKHQLEWVVSHLFDGPIAMALYQHLAVAHPSALASGLGPHPGLDLWPFRSSLSAAGLGITAP